MICDCGAFNGDTLQSYLNRKGSQTYCKYIAIEADSETFIDLKGNAKKTQLKNIQLYNLACWNEKTTLTMSLSSTSSHITSDGEVSVQADALDNLLSQEDVSFIKMDIEGAEINTLLGARGIIDKYKPTLAICIYHSFEDFYKIPLLIKELNPNYKIYIRQYLEMCIEETVCYAIPYK